MIIIMITMTITSMGSIATIRTTTRTTMT